MIVELIKKLLTFVTDTIFSVIDLPAVPEGLVNAIEYVFGYIRQGMGIVNFFLPLDQISPIIDCFLLVYAVVHGYDILMWILRKIPILGIK